ncbi:hypothetical protein ACFL0M_03545 [Thermodesulfobacteriota bacterium]
MTKVCTKSICLFALVSLLIILSPETTVAKTPLERVIEGAKKEGTITMITPTSGMTAKYYNRLRREIREKFGVDLEIKHMLGYFGKDFSKALLEQKRGITPTWDYYVCYGPVLMQSIDAGLLERVDWEPLLLPGTNPEVLLGRPPQLDVLRGYGITMYTNHLGGLIYEPSKVASIGEVPKTFSAVGDPKWKGHVGISKVLSTWLLLSKALGKEKIISGMRKILSHGAIIGGSRDLMGRYVMGEVSMICNIASTFTPRIKNKGMPAEWQAMDEVAIIRRLSSIIRKGAPHPNAAKLVAVYLASPDGYKLIHEEIGIGNAFYPGNFEYEILMRNKEQGLQTRYLEATEMMTFPITKEAKKWNKEFKDIIVGGR